MVELIISAFAVYALTTIVVDADGPFGVFYRLRKSFKALECFVCTSVYIGAGVALLITNDLSAWFIYTFGLCGAAILLNKVGNYLW